MVSFIEDGVLRTVTVTAGHSFDINNLAAGVGTLSEPVVGEIINAANQGGGWTPPPTPPGIIVEPSVSSTTGQ